MRDLACSIRESLRLVIDPELGENIVDLGLIYDVTVENGVASIRMTTTTEGCPAAAYLKNAVQAAAAAVPAILHVDVRLVYDPVWRPEMMTGSSRRRLMG